ncbi:unnamed protein product, partial [Adineta steineri]
ATANHISWCGNGGEKLAVAYCNLEFQSNTKDLSNDSYIWDIEYSSEPDYILKPISSLVCIEFNTKDKNQLIAGCYNGQVCIFDTRKGGVPVEQSLIENSHRDPVYKTIWLHTKLETEFFSASTDGKIFWWDTRRLSEPVETLILDIDKKGRIENSYGAMSLDYEPTMPMKFMVGTEQGSIVACNRKGQTNADKIGHVYAGHAGPVYALQRHPHCLKNFLSIGDWTVRIWSEEVRDDCIMLTRPSMYALTDGQWSPTRSSIFFTTKMNGTLDVWDILFKQNEPTVSVKVTNEPIHCLRVQEPHGRLIACGSQNGTVILLELSNNLYVQRKNEKSLMFDRETRRTKILEARSRMRRDVQEKSTNTEVITGKITDEYILKERELVEKAEEDFWRIINEEKNKVFNAAESDQLYNPLKDTDRHKSGNYLAITEIYNPLVDQWNITGSMGSTGYLTECEIYDPSTGQWHTAASMAIPRKWHTATLLKSGQVIITGGTTTQSDVLVNSTEIYDPLTDKWSHSASMTTAHSEHTAILLSSGKVLVFGSGISSEIYDPLTDQWNPVASMKPPARYYSIAAQLKSGKVLVTGGVRSAIYQANCDIYNPSTDQWDTIASMTAPRAAHTLILLNSGKVLVTGGETNDQVLASCETYDPSTGKWTNVPSMIQERSSHTTTLLKSGKVLATAGEGLTHALNSSEIYDPSTGKWNSSARLSLSRASHTATLLNSGKVLVAGGQ